MTRYRSGTGPALDLGAAEIELGPAAPVRTALASRLGEVSRYPEPLGLPRLREAVAGHLPRFGVDAEGPHQVAVTPGATAALTALVLSRTAPGATVLVPDPGWAMYRRLVLATGRTPVPYRVPGARGPRDDADWLAELDELAAGAGALIWNTPHNPLGRVATAAECEAVVRLAGAHDVFLISDEVFSDLVWTSRHVSPLHGGIGPGRAGVWSASKSLRLAGHRVGWLCADEATATLAGSVAWATTMGASMLGQLACLAALEHYDEVAAESRAHVRTNLYRFAAGLAGRAPVPDAGMFVWLDVADLAGTAGSGTSAAQLLAEHYRLKVWPGERFGPAGAGRIRVNAGIRSGHVGPAVDRLVEFFDRAGATPQLTGRPA